MLEYDLVVNRSDARVYAVIDGTYYVQVTNTGCEATSDLHVVTTIQGLDNGTWVDIDTLDVAYSTVIQPGETVTYEAPVYVEGNYAAYRAITHTTIDNYVGHIGQRYGVVNYDGLETLERESAAVDESGVLTDLGLTVPEGFTYEPVGYDGPYDVSGSGEYRVLYNVTNVNATEGGLAVNRASLELPSGAYVNSTAAIGIEALPTPEQVYVPLTIVNDAEDAGDTDFLFRLTIGGQPYTGGYYVDDGLRYTDDGAISLKAGESAGLEVPEGSTVQVLAAGPTLWRVTESLVNGALPLEDEDARLRTLIAGAQGDGDVVSYTSQMAEDVTFLLISKGAVKDDEPYHPESPVAFTFLVEVDGIPYVGGFYKGMYFDVEVINGDPELFHTDDGRVEAIIAPDHWGYASLMDVPVGSEVTVTEVPASGYGILWSESGGKVGDSPNRLEGLDALTQTLIAEDVPWANFGNEYLL